MAKFERIPKTWEGFKLEEDDFSIGMEGVTIGYNSHVIKYIMLIQKRANKLRKIREICDSVRCTGIPCSMDKHTERMHIELDAQMQVVKEIEEVLGDDFKL